MTKRRFRLHALLFFIFAPILLGVGIVSIIPGYIESNKIVKQQLDAFWQQQEEVSNLTLEFELGQLANIVSLVGSDMTLANALTEGNMELVQSLLFTAFDTNISGHADQLILHNATSKEYVHAGYELIDLKAAYQKITRLLPFSGYQFIEVKGSNSKPMVLAVYSIEVTHGNFGKVIGYVTGIYLFNERVSLNSLFKENTGAQGIQIIFESQVISTSQVKSERLKPYQFTDGKSVTFSLSPFDLETNLKLRLITESSPLTAVSESIANSLMFSAIMLLLSAVAIAYAASYQTKKFIDRLLNFVRDVTSKDPNLEFEASAIQEVNEVTHSLGNVVKSLIIEKDKSELAKQNVDKLNDELKESVSALQQEMDDRQAAQSALRTSERQQRDLLNNTSSVIYIKDLDGRYLFINRMFEQLFHITDQEITGKYDHDIFPKEIADIFRENDRKIIELDRLLEYEEIAPHDDGEHTYLSVKFPLKKESGYTYAICGISTDITERKIAEDNLKHLRNYLSNIIDSMPSALIGVDIDGKVTQWNDEASRLSGVSKEQALGHLLTQSFQRLSSEMQHVHEAIESRQELTFSKKQYEKDGVTRYEDMTIYPLVANGVEGAVIRLDDITEKNINEIALRRAQKMEAIGQLTGGIAHDFNNILGIVMGNLHLLRTKLADDEEALKRIDKALNGTQRGADITRKLLNFSRQKANETNTTIRTDVNKVIENMDELIAKSLTVSIEVQTFFSDNLWPVNVDQGDLEDAILNLSLNAKDAMPKGGSLIFETSNKVLDDHYVKINPDSKSGDFVMISISDNGLGMSDKVKEKVLEPFFSTKGHGKGTGLGLSMVYGFVQRSGGHIKIYSELGEGTTFHLFLPRSMDGVQDDPHKNLSSEDLPRGTETILIVDDEDALLDIAVEYLNQLGYSSLIASDAKQALQILDDNKNIDLVFSDVIMPGDMDGYQLAETVHKKYPDCKVLLTSGFTKKREEELGSKNTYTLRISRNRLHKPYNQSELAIAIRQTMDEPS